MKSVLGNTRFKTESQITLKSDKLALFHTSIRIKDYNVLVLFFNVY